MHGLISLYQNNIRYLILLLLLSLFVPQTNAQQVIWANKNNLDKRTDFTKVIGQNRFGVFVLKHKNSTFRRYFILEQFDKKMNLLKSKTFKIPGGELEKIVVTDNQVVYFTKVYGKGFFYTLKMQTIDSSMNESAPQTIVDSESFNNETINFRIEYTHKKDKFLIWYMLETGEKTKIVYHLCNTNNLIKKGENTIESNLSEIYVGDAVLDDSANLFIFYSKSERFKSKNSEDFFHYVYGYNLNSGKVLNQLINNTETYVSSYKIAYNYSNNTVTAIGFHGIENEDENKGYFSVIVDCSLLNVRQTVFKDFDRKIVSQIIGAKNEKNGEQLSKFKIKKLIPKIDGGILIIAERSYVTTQSEIFYVNGIPQSSYAKIFNNDEVLLLSTDSIGNTLWTDVIIKNQSTVNDGGYYNGIIVMVNDDQINILYNDKLNANADIIQVSYLPNGEHTKKILLNNDQYYALVIPAEYNQVTANSIVIPINQNRDFTYIKLLY